MDTSWLDLHNLHKKGTIEYEYQELKYDLAECEYLLSDKDLINHNEFDTEIYTKKIKTKQLLVLKRLKELEDEYPELMI